MLEPDFGHISCQPRRAQVRIRSTILDDKEEAAIRPHAFLMRMLANLKGAYLRQNDPEKCLRIQQYLRCAHARRQSVRCQSKGALGACKAGPFSSMDTPLPSV